LSVVVGCGGGPFNGVQVDKNFLMRAEIMGNGTGRQWGLALPSGHGIARPRHLTRLVTK